MTTNRSVLGKGLSALIPNTNQAQQHSWGATMNTVPDTEHVAAVPIDAVSANPYQPRTHFDHDQLEELAQSIKEYGIIQPLIVTLEAPGRYQLIAGERRLKAAKLIGLTQVPVVLRKAEDQKKLEISLIENLQRHNLNPLEEALGYKRLMDEFSLTQEEVAARVGKSRSSVANFLRVLSLPKAVLEALEQEVITFSHAKVILSAPTPKEQIHVFERIVKQNMTVAQATKATMPKQAHASKKVDPVLATWEERLTTTLGFQTHIRKSGKGGSVEIAYDSEEDLKTLLDALLRS